MVPTTYDVVTKDAEMIINCVSRAIATLHNLAFPIQDPLARKLLYNADSVSTSGSREAVRVAQAAFNEWKAWSPTRRRHLFEKVAELVDSLERQVQD